ncbi:MAG TPA: ribonuclease PH [Trueperaceae bacterium]|nr:ribonuclease PH [Trueperaceae bacterium]
MRQGRALDEIRKIEIIPAYNRYAEGSALVKWGHTHVLATVTIDKSLPPHLRAEGHKGGWLTAEYAMLPRSAKERIRRERLYTGGRSLEIQRLISRTLRTVVDLKLFPKKTLILDIDILQADGGTRCAGILAAYAALHEMANRLILSGKISEWPLKTELAAVSVGIADGKKLLDLEYSEDNIAQMDLNVIATADGKIVEIQGGSEADPVTVEEYFELVYMGIKGIKDIFETVRPQLK